MVLILVAVEEELSSKDLPSFQIHYTGVGKINAVIKTLEIIKPGISCKEVYESLSKNLFSKNVKSNVGRMGHGFGLQLTEPPSIMIDDNTILEKNMILALEPSIEIENDLMLVHEENILITQNGNRLLTSRTPKELPVINV